MQPFNRSYPFIGRVDVDYIAPPRTIARLKRSICAIERVRDPSCMHLYISSTSPSPMSEEPPLTSIDPGSTLEAPMALVIKAAETDYASLIFGSPSNMNRAVYHAVGSSFAESTTHLESSSRYCEWRRICAYHISRSQVRSVSCLDQWSQPLTSEWPSTDCLWAADC
jgi:hypothetical protein